ncbi:MAG: NB-ARC domain-containing protein [Nostoc sp. ChiSLP01]|nr:NB-ARC domain-containing protein [Nostoc sp. CmiSLP01]MDZ8284406.1 NB-ARC domain-containing protein [Nostoc sp. ChiSLP01]
MSNLIHRSAKIRTKHTRAAMPRSLRVAPKYISKVRSALQHRGFPRQQDLAEQVTLSRDTVSKFLNGKTVDYLNFVEICQQLDLDWQDIIDLDESRTQSPDQGVSFFSYDSSHWVGREQLVEELSKKIEGWCRLLLILGFTGIGKTALAERLVVELQDRSCGDWTNNLLRLNFDNKMESTDFASVATKCLEGWREEISFDSSKPELLLQRLVKYLQNNQVLVLIDSLERLLEGNEEDGWNDFIDEWWEKFFLSILSAESCQSRFIVTSQDFTVQLQYYRYKNFWHRETLNGLNELEQRNLFKKIGFDSLQDKKLLQIGKACRGHPLALRVITTELIDSFDGNLQAFWNRYGDEIKKIEEASEAIEDDRSIINFHINIINYVLFWKKRLTAFLNKLLNKKLVNKEVLQENFMAHQKIGQLYKRDVFMLIDQSFSMSKKDVVGSDLTRWDSLRELVMSDANRILKQNISDSISLYLFSRNELKKEIFQIEDPQRIENIFSENEPDRSTFVVPTLKYCIDKWRDNRSQTKTQGAFFIIYTDGVFDDKNAFEKLIRETCREIDNQQIIKIFIIGVGSEIKTESNRNDFEALNKNAKNNIDKNGKLCDIVGFALADEMEDIIQVLKDELQQDVNT